MEAKEWFPQAPSKKAIEGILFHLLRFEMKKERIQAPFLTFSEGGLGETALSLPLLGEGGP